jgi:hypothetical protein
VSRLLADAALWTITTTAGAAPHHRKEDGVADSGVTAAFAAD